MLLPKGCNETPGAGPERVILGFRETVGEV